MTTMVFTSKNSFSHWACPGRAISMRAAAETNQRSRWAGP